jgi:hypothetical protein
VSEGDGNDDRTARSTDEEDSDTATAPDRLPSPSHWLVGARGGFVAVPQGFVRYFVDGGQDQLGGAVGVFAGYQRNAFEVTASVWWGDYSYDGEVIFEGPGDRNDPEFINNDLSLLVIEAQLVWAHWFTSWLGATVGAGLGLGVVLGEVRRTEATPPMGPYAGVDEVATDGFVHCRYDPADPQWSTPFCEPMCDATSLADGTCPPRPTSTDDDSFLGYYDSVEKGIPSVVPWLNLLFGIRLLPHPRLQVDLQTGLGLGFLFIAKAAYRF